MTNVPSEVVGIFVVRHPKDPSMGNKIVWLWNKLLMERGDAANFVEGEVITLMRHSNVIVERWKENQITKAREDGLL
ncbi:hypothetical protein G195_011428 [Phytophthora kernoviae 00238/432]|uniref:Glutamyl/glutaminyl-tRNA synthetase class Ib anti-codon binding domain-containing protein n=1 Tax=Phytophthora kernoviae 00238/432 TaxID=1284355 RepID=A0A8J4RV69_9STRA|nr:hypothetical protein G195_011428 [Phytophthora kernoviae 00238/432]